MNKANKKEQSFDFNENCEPEEPQSFDEITHENEDIEL
jgi:hypothetical protein